MQTINNFVEEVTVKEEVLIEEKVSALVKIQRELKVPKNNYNSFGKYKYRSAEDIVEAAKNVIHKYGFYLTLTDEVLQVGNRIYIQATATLSNGIETHVTTALAREPEVKKGMDESQITGTASSYARKYALNGLFAIDDTKDADFLNTGDNSQNKSKTSNSVKPAELTKTQQIKSLREKLGMTPNDLFDFCKKFFPELGSLADLTESQKDKIIVELSKAG